MDWSIGVNSPGVVVGVSNAPPPRPVVVHPGGGAFIPPPADAIVLFNGLDLDAWPHTFTEGASPDAPVVLTLHGTGGDEHEIAALGTALVCAGPVIASPVAAALRD